MSKNTFHVKIIWKYFECANDRHPKSVGGGVVKDCFSADIQIYWQNRETANINQMYNPKYTWLHVIKIGHYHSRDTIDFRMYPGNTKQQDTFFKIQTK